MTKSIATQLRFIILTTLVVLSGLCNSAFTQNSPKAKKAYDKALKQYEKENYGEVLSLYNKALTYERELGDSSDKLFIGKLLFEYARFYISPDYYGVASQFFFFSAISYQSGGDSVNAEKALQQSSYFADSSLKHQSQYIFSRDSILYEYTRIPIRSIDRINGDTTWFTVSLGTRDSMRFGQTGSMVTIYDTTNTAREVDFFGSAVLTELDFGLSKWYTVIDKDFKKKSIPLQKGDLLYTKVVTDAEVYQGLINDLLKVSVSFVDYNGPMYDYWRGQLITSERIEELLIDMMGDVVRKTAKTLYDPQTSSNMEILDSGAFAGGNMWEGMLQSTNYDIKAFLRFVKSFPGKYMGRNYRIDETFATWLINFTPTGDDEADFIMRAYEESQTQESLDNWINTSGRYLEVAEFDYQKIIDPIYEFINEKEFKTSDSIINKWLYITKTLELDSMYQEFRILEGQNRVGKKQFEAAIDIYESILEVKPNHLNAHWYLGHALAENEEYTKALKEYQYIIDNAEWFAGGYDSYGWTLLKIAKNQKAFEYLQKAYMLDSSNATYIMNYAHGNVVMGNSKEARRLYNHLLENLPDEETYTEGLLADFDYFISNGRRPDEFKLEKSHMASEWEKHYQYKVKGNEFFLKGQKLEKKEKHIEAAAHFDSAISLEKQGLVVRHRLLRSYHRWAAFNYYKTENHGEALARYRSGWDINRNHIDDVELEIEDLTAISNEYSWLDNNLRKDMYRKMQYAAQRRFQNLQRSNDLYMVSIGLNGTPNQGYLYAESDAQRISNTIADRSKLIFDNSYISHFEGDVATVDTIKKAVNQVLARSKPGDCFIFYFSGYTQSDHIIIGDDTLTNRQILAWLASMPATKQIVLIDAANTSLVSDFIKNQQNNQSDFSTQSVVLMISDGRVEMPNTKGGLFTSFLIDGINGDAATQWKNEFTENKDSASKIAYVTTKSLEGYMYGNMSSGNLEFDLKSYSSGTDFPLTFINTLSYIEDTVPPMIYIPNTISQDGKRGGRTKIVTISKNVGGQALDESGIEEITVNGHSVDFTQNGKFNLNENFTGAWTKLVISARDKKGNVSLDSFFVNKSDSVYSDPASQSKKQRNYALLFATNEYDQWSDLANPKRDVRAIARQLEDNYGFEVQVVEDTTIEGMKSILLGYMKKQYGPKDQLFVFFAGHGHYDPYRGGHIVGKDSKLDDNNLTSYLRFKSITDDLNNIYGCKHIFLALDVCFGGAAFDKDYAVSYTGSSLQDIINNRDNFIKAKLNSKSRVFITSGSIEYVPDESQFAKKFLETLESGGPRKNGLLTFDDFTSNMQTIVSLPQDQRPTTPRYGSFGDHQSKGDFILIYQPKQLPKSDDMKTGKKALP